MIAVIAVIFDLHPPPGAAPQAFEPAAALKADANNGMLNHEQPSADSPRALT
jgi:hypothetical protein